MIEAGRLAARQNPPVAHPAVGGRQGGGHRPPHAGGEAAGRRQPLDGARDGQGQRGIAGQGAPDLAEGRPGTASLPAVQAVERSRLCRKIERVVGLYVDPPQHAVVLSIDEKSQIQALDRTQPGLPMKTGRAGTMTHDYKRNGTTTLFAALNTLDGTVIGRCRQRHRHQEFLAFLNDIERKIPAGKVIHVVLDNYAAHKHRKVHDWLHRHPRWTFHFTPTSCSWLNAVEGFFAKLTQAAQARRLSFPRRAPDGHQPLHRRPHQAQAISLAGRSQQDHRRPKPRVPYAEINPQTLGGSAFQKTPGSCWPMF